MDFDAGMGGPWQGIGSLSHKPRGIFWARELKTKQESFKMRFKGDKVENVQMKLKNHSPWRGSRCRLEIRGPAEVVPSSSPKELKGRNIGATPTAGVRLPRAQRKGAN